MKNPIFQVLPYYFWDELLEELIPESYFNIFLDHEEHFKFLQRNNPTKTQ